MIEGYDDKFLQTFEYETTAVGANNIVGTCELGTATIQLINESNNYSSLKGLWIKTIHGSFYIYDVKPVQEKVNIKLECYDIKYKLDKKYDKTKHIFPCTLKEWRNSIFDDCDVEYDNSDFPNSSLQLNEQPYVEENASNRNVIQTIAQAGASWIETDKEDIFYFKWFTDIIHEVKDWIELTTEKELTSPINTVVLGRGSIEDNVFYPLEKPTNPVEFRIDNNYILDSQDTISSEDNRYQNIIPIYNRIVGMQYLIFNLKSHHINNKLSIKLGDKIKYKDIWGNEIIAPIMKKRIIYLAGDVTDSNNYYIELSAEELNETSTNFKYATSIKNELVRVERKADKNSGEISDTVEKIENIKHTVDNSNITNNNTYQELISKLDNIPSNDDIITLTEKVEQIQTSTQATIKIVQDLQVNGVDKVVTETGVTVDIEGMHIDKTNAKTSTTVDSDGISVIEKGSNSSLLFAGYDVDTQETIVKSKNMTVEKYLVVPRTRFEAYENQIFGKATGSFYIDN